ncbi:uncharacterized protein LOC108091193 [Drosophila ficusphila]|uniref:uncharacterized protein LOC108091193 n=1 Tax=Drosophila ficusphila TaxID=30025 RepID=UPI0007E68ED4|nr:uncharacterized protein LOC108091193 [Drosophila ficusphila]
MTLSFPGNVLLLAAALGGCLVWSLPMTPEQEQELRTDVRPITYQLAHVAKSEAESEYVGRIPPHDEHSVEEDPEFAVHLVEQLEAAGVESADRRALSTLSYKELVRLLALWHINQERNVYEANGPDQQPDQAIDAR